MELILQTIKDLGLWSAGLALLLAYWLFVFAGLHEDTARVTRERWIKRLRYEDWEQSYRAWIGQALDRIDRFLPPELSRGAPFGPGSLRAAWSHGALNLTLLLALAYPALSALLQWVGTGREMFLGELLLIPAEPQLLPRLATIGAIGVMIFCFIMARRASAQTRTGYAVFWFGLAVAFAGAFAVVGAFAFAGAGAVVVAFVVVGAFLQERLGRHYGRPGIALLIYYAALFAPLCAAILLAPELRETPKGEDPRAIILFLAVLPLLNALTDFGSLGLTRWLLRRNWPFALSWLADILGALFFLLLFCAASIAFVALVTPQDGAPLIDLTALFAAIRERPEDHRWLAFMVFSTLLPTIVHLILALSSTILIAPIWLRRRIANGLEAGAEGDIERGRNAKLALAILAAFAMWWPAFVVLYGGWWIRSADHGLRDGLLRLAERWAGWLV